MKIIAIKVERLINNKHFTFMQFVLAALGQFNLLESLFGLQIETFRSAFEKEDEVHMKHNRNFLTPAVQEADDERDARFRYVHDAIKLATQDVDGEKAEDALFLMGIVKDYGGINIMRMPVDAESGALTNLSSDLLEKYTERVAHLGLTEAVERMKAANEEYIRLSGKRTLDESKVDKEAMATARRETDKAYRGLVDTINLYTQYHGDGELLPFIKYLNAEIERYRIQIGQGVGNSSSDAGTTEEGAAKFKNATFVYIGGTEMKFRVEVGTPIPVQSNTEGYRWNPEVPALMPKRSITFREVAIDREEGEAIFHFLDHHEEILRQHVGTELVAPLNTENCIWVPTPPELMPAGQTNYAEELAQQILNPAENITIKFRGIDNQILHEFVVPEDYQMTEEEYPTPPEGTHWNFTLADLNLAIGMKNPGDTITVRAQA